MITTEQQLGISRAATDRFEQTLKRLDSELPALPAGLAQAERTAIQSQLETLRIEIAEYEALQIGVASSIRR